MSAELIVLSVGAAAAALIVTRVLSLRAAARGVPRSTGRAPRCSWARRDRRSMNTLSIHRPRPSIEQRIPAVSSNPVNAILVNAHRSRPDIHHGPAPRGGGNTYDPRPLEDKARQRIAYQLIALLALMIVVLLAGVVFGVIPILSTKLPQDPPQGVRRDPWSARGAGFGGHRLLLRNQEVADSAAAG